MEQLNLSIDDGQIEQLVTYAGLLTKWNKTFNLISRSDIARLVPRHLLDSLVALPMLRGEHILDLGSGAGLPGIPLAVAAPQLSFILCERSARKTRFLQQAVDQLTLGNIQVWLGNFGVDPPPRPQFDTVVARGVATGIVVWDMVRVHLAAEGRVLVFESTQSAETNTELPRNREIQISRNNYDIPGLAQTHSILCFEAI